MMRILVCGGRKWGYSWSKYWEEWVKDHALFNEAAEEIQKKYKPTFVIYGAAKGADEVGESLKKMGVEGKAYPADWKTHGRAAGPIRNQQMLEEGKPDLVIAFSGGAGTADMTRRAKNAGVEVIKVVGPKIQESK